MIGRWRHKLMALKTTVPTRRPFGLRLRIIAAFGLGALFVSMILSVTTYSFVRHTLVEQRESLAERQTFVNARLVRSGLRTSRIDIPKLLGSLENPTGSEAVLFHEGKWYTSNIQVSQDSIPAALRAKVTDSSVPASMRFRNGATAQLAIGIPIPAINASYFEISTMSEVDRTVQTLSVTLFFASLFTTVAGLALGSWASRIVLQPVKLAASAAERIAGGDMDARLQPDGDRDLDRLVLSFNSMVDAVQSRIKRDARFASDVSHELRSPLMTLTSGLSVMQSRRNELPLRSQTALDLLADEIIRFQRMVQDLLEISRSDAGHTDAVFEEVLAGEFVTRVVEMYERTIPIEAKGAAGEAVLAVDKRRMVRVIGNLIENADRYAGGVTNITIEEVNDKIRIVVDDEGPGVPVEEHDRIFERFARGASAKVRASGEGTGLGLSLVDEHVRMHGGRVWVDTNPSRGARFIVELPQEEQ